jgi:hypothetical protein
VSSKLPLREDLRKREKREKRGDKYPTVLKNSGKKREANQIREADLRMAAEDLRV